MDWLYKSPWVDGLADLVGDLAYVILWVFSTLGYWLGYPLEMMGLMKRETASTALVVIVAASSILALIARLFNIPFIGDRIRSIFHKSGN